MGILKKLRDPGSWLGALATNITASVIFTYGVPVLAAILTFVGGLIEHLGFTRAFVFALFALAASAGCVLMIQQLYRLLVALPVDRRYRDFMRPFIEELEGKRKPRDEWLQDWIQRTDAALQPQLAPHHLDQFREIANRKGDAADLRRQRLINWLKAYFGV